MSDEQKIEIFKNVEPVNFLFAVALITCISLIALTLFLFIKQPKSFCTFEKMDLGKIAKEVVAEIDKEKTWYYVIPP